MRNRLMLSRIWSSVFCPHYGFRIAAVDGELITDCTFQLDGTAMSIKADLPLGQHGEPTFDLFEPGGSGKAVQLFAR
jgi:hypothetical protein